MIKRYGLLAGGYTEEDPEGTLVEFDDVAHLVSRIAELEARLQHRFVMKADISKEPHWLYKDFNVLYRAALRFSEARMGRADDGRPYAAHEALKVQLRRLAPAFTDTEEVRKAMRGE